MEGWTNEFPYYKSIKYKQAFIPCLGISLIVAPKPLGIEPAFGPSTYISGCEWINPLFIIIEVSFI